MSSGGSSRDGEFREFSIDPAAEAVLPFFARYLRKIGNLVMVDNFHITVADFPSDNQTGARSKRFCAVRVYIDSAIFVQGGIQHVPMAWKTVRRASKCVTGLPG
jgi:hypothetical protein